MTQTPRDPAEKARSDCDRPRHATTASRSLAESPVELSALGFPDAHAAVASDRHDALPVRGESGIGEPVALPTQSEQLGHGGPIPDEDLVVAHPGGDQALSVGAQVHAEDRLFPPDRCSFDVLPGRDVEHANGALAVRDNRVVAVGVELDGEQGDVVAFEKRAAISEFGVVAEERTVVHADEDVATPRADLQRRDVELLRLGVVVDRGCAELAPGRSMPGDFTRERRAVERVGLAGEADESDALWAVREFGRRRAFANIREESDAVSDFLIRLLQSR